MSWEVVSLLVGLSAIGAFLTVAYWDRQATPSAELIKDGFNAHAESIKNLAIEVEKLKKVASEAQLAKGMRLRG